MRDARTYFSTDDLSRLHIVRRLTPEREVRIVAMRGGTDVPEKGADSIECVFAEPQVRNLIAILSDLLGPERPRPQLWRDDG